jgi:hypothetical protein
VSPNFNFVAHSLLVAPDALTKIAAMSAHKSIADGLFKGR